MSDGRASDNPRAAQKGRPKGSSNRGKDGGGGGTVLPLRNLTPSAYLFDTFYVKLFYRLSKRMLKNEKEGQFSEEPVNSVFAGRAILAITFTQWFQKLSGGGLIFISRFSI